MHNSSRLTRSIAPVTWADMVHIQASHGVRPTGTKPARSCRFLHEVYDAWVADQRLAPGRDYLMPVYLLSGHVRMHLDAKNVLMSNNQLYALIVNALNHPRAAFEIAARPYHRGAA